MDKGILKEIEDLRFQLVQSAQSHGFTAQKTVKVSQRLDELLNTYLYLNKKEK